MVLLYGISCLLDFGFELQNELATDYTVGSEALRTGQYSRVKYVYQIPLAHKHMVKKVPMLGQMMHPGCFQTIFLWKIVFVMASW